MTRTEWILAAVRAELERRRHVLDGDPSLKTFVCIVQLSPGQGHPRSIQTKFEHEERLVAFEEKGLTDAGASGTGRVVLK